MLNTTYNDKKVDIWAEQADPRFTDIPQLPHNDLRKVMVVSKYKHFSRKSIIYQAQEAVNGVYVIRSGMVKLLSYLPNGKSRIVRLSCADHWLGLEGMLGQTYEHTAIAVNDVDVDFIPLNRLSDIGKENPALYCQILKQLHSHILQADKWITDFSTGGIKARVARLVEFLSYREKGHSGARVKLLTVAEIANIIGVTAESVSRILASFKRNDILNKQVGTLKTIYDVNSEKILKECRK